MSICLSANDFWLELCMTSPQPPDPAVERGIAALRAGDLAGAEIVLGGVVARDPNNFVALHFLGLVYFQTGRQLDGVEKLRQATSLRPAYYPALSNMGNMLAAMGRHRDAVAAYDRAITLQPVNDMPHYNRAIALQALGRNREALAAYDNAIRLRPAHAQAHSNRGSVLLALGRPAEALAGFETALGLDPTLPQTHNNRGNSLKELGRLDEALASYDRALACDPSYAEALNNRGTALQALGRTMEAAAAYDAAIAIHPALAEARYNRANAKQQAGELAAAIADYRAVLDRDPDYVKAHYNLGIALHDAGRPVEAIASFQSAVALQPDHYPAMVNQSHSLLSLGRMAEAWPLYHHRDAQFPLLQRDPRYLTRERLPAAVGKRVLVVWEVGLGDTLQFIRYVRLLHDHGVVIQLSVQSTLRRLVSTLDVPVEHIDFDWRTMFRMGQTTDRFDYIIRMMSLPSLFTTDIDTIPAAIPYLSAEPELVAHWRAVIGTNGRRIGISWLGSNRIELGQRSFPLTALCDIARLPETRLISLQKSADAIVPADGPVVELLGDGFDAGPDGFRDTAAVMASCDLVITCDTAIAHLAGALGARCWIALGYVPDWRWLRDRSDSPWYPTVRLFRQGPDRSWAPVFAAMELALRGDR